MHFNFSNIESWDHGCVPDYTTLRKLLDTQVPGLTVLQLDNYASGPMGLYHAVPGLQSFQVNSLSPQIGDWPMEILSRHSPSLKDLCLGAEANAIKHYYHPQPADLGCYDRIQDDVMDVVAKSAIEPETASHETTVDQLRLIGLDGTRFIRSGCALWNYRKLTSLSLESCRGIEQIFVLLVPPTGGQGLSVMSEIRLQTFRLRHENSSQHFRDQLCDFLITLPGLVNLSILCEYHDTLLRTPKFKEVMSTHGKTLKSLVWEERKGAQTAYRHPATWLPSPKQLIELMDHCQDLAELGVPLDWQILAETDSTTYNVGTSIQSLS